MPTEITVQRGAQRHPAGTRRPQAEDALDVEVIRQRLADDRPWLSEDELDTALRRAAEGASGQKSA